MPTCLETSPSSPGAHRQVGAQVQQGSDLGETAPFRAWPWQSLEPLTALHPPLRRHPRPAAPRRQSGRICQRALYSCRQLPSVMFSNTTPRPPPPRASRPRSLRQEDSFKGRSVASRLPAASFLSQPPGCSQYGPACTPGLQAGACRNGRNAPPFPPWVHWREKSVMCAPF